MITKNTDNRTTSDELYRSLDTIFNFKLDAAASKQNTKCDKFYTISNSGLKNKWLSTTFCNPPYDNIEPWISKAIEEVFYNYVTSVFILPCDPSTQWFNLVWKYSKLIYFPNKRFGFGYSSVAKSAIVIPVFTKYTYINSWKTELEKTFRGKCIDNSI